MASRDLYLFPDTNFFIQCKDIGELPWDIWADRSLVRLIVCRPVQSEIDNHKGRGNDRVGRRARKAAGILREVIAAKTPKIIRAEGPRVELDVRISLKPSPDLADDLDYSEADDKIVGVAHAFAKSAPDADVMVISADGGPLASAGMANVAAYPIPDEWLQPPEKTEAEKELGKAREQLQRLQKQEPSFLFCCGSGLHKDLSKLDLEYRFFEKLEDVDINHIVERLRDAFPKKANFSVEELNKNLPNISKIIRSTYLPPRADDISSYQDRYEAWIEGARKILSTIHIRLNEAAKPKFVVEIENNGTRPAKDALVQFRALGPFEVRRPPDKDDTSSAERLLNFGRPPEPPQPQLIADAMRPLYDRLPTGFLNPRGQSLVRDMVPLRMPPVATGRNPNAFYYSKSKIDAGFALTCEQWRHGVGPEQFHGVFFASEVPGIVTGVIECQIHAENLSNAVTIPTPVQLTITAASTAKAVRRLVDDHRS
ncbi:PIN domain-containing protein [Mesorhizobium sp. 8]|uniref:PIN domain-containing protein n=1 Tax=Mesorhizobium sp. 8 TaxID=2584466 RepID=UPI00111E89F3|nr:PIN domain-containing protein [Mesorhizobium sp. 8]QDB99727.1 hypothetical protein FGU64_04510 [Mesorhizobium sp. 8]